MRFLILALLACLCAGVPAAAQQATPPAGRVVEAVTVEGTEFVVRLSDGATLRSRDLAGAVINLQFGGKPARLRVAAVERDPDDPTGSVWLHTLETEAADGAWHNHCTPGPDGRRQSFPLEGGPQGAELVCTSGGIAKCVRFGYRRWTATPAGESLAPLHAACLRMLRGDYGGDRGWTENGRAIYLYDHHGVQPPDAEMPHTFEAGWSSEGAVCVHHVRVKKNVTLAGLEARYPHLRGRTGEICTEAFARQHGAVIFNRSTD